MFKVIKTVHLVKVRVATAIAMSHATNRRQQTTEIATGNRQTDEAEAEVVADLALDTTILIDVTLVRDPDLDLNRGLNTPDTMLDISHHRIGAIVIATEIIDPLRIGITHHVRETTIRLLMTGGIHARLLRTLPIRRIIIRKMIFTTSLKSHIFRRPRFRSTMLKIKMFVFKSIFIVY